MSAASRSRKYRLANREKRNKKKREWARRNAEHVRNYQSQWCKRQPPQYWKRWPSHKPKTGLGRWPKGGRTYAQILASNKERRRRMCKDLSDSYLRGWMSRTSGYMIKPSEWPDDLVELKRAQMKVSRTCQKSRRTIS